MWIAPIPGSQVIWTANLNLGLCGESAWANSNVPTQPLPPPSFGAENGVRKLISQDKDREIVCWLLLQAKETRLGKN